MTKIRAAITGIHGWTPEDVLTNSDLEKMVDTTDEWITTRTGIKERHILKGEKGTSDMAVEAVRGLLEKTGTDPEEVDMLICATVTPDMQFPATANLVSHKLGIKNAFSFDMNAACSTFIYALITGSKYVESGEYKKVVVIGGDKMSSIVDYTDRATCVIFGDGAGAVMLEPTTDDQPGIMDHRFYTDGAGWIHLHQKAGGSLKPASHATVDAKEHFIYQEGQPVFKFAVTRMADVAAEIMERNQLKSEDVAWLVPHQANLRIIDATAKRMGVSKDKVMINIQHFGNTTNGTIPLCLYEWEPQLKKGDNVVLAAFGGGFTWGAIYLKWAYDGKK